jgi:uncharacterized membrane protein HdeD (DUF308 family)
MTSEVTSQTTEMIEQAKPWRKGVSWVVVLIEGIVALALGLYILLNPNSGPQIVVLLSIYLLVLGVLRVFNSLRGRIDPLLVPYQMLSGGIALTVGVLVLIDLWQDFMESTVAAVMLAVGLLLIGVVGMLEWFMARRKLGGRIMTLIVPAACAIIGFLVLGSGLQMAATALQAIAWVSIISGIGLGIYAFVLRNQQSEAAATTPASAAAAPPAAATPTAPPAAAKPPAPPADGSAA